MTRTSYAAAVPPTFRLRRHEWASIISRAARTRRGAIGLGLVLIVVLIAFAGPAFAPHSSTTFVTGPFAPPSGQALLGGDDLGRDVLSRILDGGWMLILMAVAATTFGVIVGSAAGIAAAYLQGWTDAAIMRAVDVLLAFPQLVFALLVVSIAGPKVWLIIGAVGLAHAPQVARVMRAAAIGVSERDHVKAVELLGIRPWRIMTREILPNVMTPLMVEAGLRLTYSIVIIAGLSFLGFGLQPPAPNWGLMINTGRVGLAENPWGVVAPAALIAVLTIGTNTFTDAVARVALGVEGGEQDPIAVNLVGLESVR